MRNVVLTTVLLLNLTCFAQVEKPKMEEWKAKMEKLESFTPEQQAELQLKKMTLDLSLDTKQQEQLKKVLLNQAKKRETTRKRFFFSFCKYFLFPGMDLTKGEILLMWELFHPNSVLPSISMMNTMQYHCLSQPCVPRSDTSICLTFGYPKGC